jgi:hypothetical protein
MACFTPAFRVESEQIHNEHKAITEDLVQLERCLDRLVCYAEVFADLSSAAELRSRGRQLARQLPEHCQREEARLLDAVADVSPELAEFSRQMKLAHESLLAQLRAFARELEELENSSDLEIAIRQVKAEGRELARQLREHVAVEEHELSGFL